MRPRRGSPRRAARRRLPRLRLSPTPTTSLTPQEKAAGWTLLWDGKTWNGWECTDKTPDCWIIDDNAMCYTVKGHGYEYTKQTFGNFEFKCDFMVDKGTNSGIFFRWADLGRPRPDRL